MAFRQISFHSLTIISFSSFSRLSFLSLFSSSSLFHRFLSSLFFFSFFLTSSLYFFLSPTLLPLPSLARPSLSHWFPMGASYSALAVTVGHLVTVGLGRGSQFSGGSDLVVGEILWWLDFVFVMVVVFVIWWFGGWVFVLWLVIWWFVMDGFWWLFCNWWFVMAGFW